MGTYFQSRRALPQMHINCINSLKRATRSHIPSHINKFPTLEVYLPSASPLAVTIRDTSTPNVPDIMVEHTMTIPPSATEEGEAEKETVTPVREGESEGEMLL